MKIVAKVDSSEVDDLLDELKRRGSNLKPALRSIEQAILSGIEDIFEKEGDPKWKKLSKVTKRAKEKAGRDNTKILTFSGALATSIQQGGEIVGNNVYVGTNVEYAPYHQEGRKQRVTPKQRQWLGKNLGLWKKVGSEIKLPKREFLTITQEAENEAVDILNDHLLKGL